MLTNGLAFSPDGGTLYHADTRRQTVNRYAVEPDGSLGGKAVFATMDKGSPDGLAVSVDGRVWVASAGGHGVANYSSTGAYVDFIEIPQPMCTSVCFGGNDLTDLYIVSGAGGMPSDRAGAIYRLKVDVPGVAVPPARVRVA
jgi:xylono-1,5-lactonase